MFNIPADKEAWDAQHPPHVADGMDAVATVVGSALGGLAVHLVLR